MNEKQSTPARSRLSAVSQKYDVDGDGRLDDVEQAMRDMDTSGRGYMSNEKVHDLMTKLLAAQKELFTMKKIVIGWVIVDVIVVWTDVGFFQWCIEWVYFLQRKESW